jgi:hypothetical protein
MELTHLGVSERLKHRQKTDAFRIFKGFNVIFTGF